MPHTYRVTNWPQYNRALVERGSLELWIDPRLEKRWYSSASGTRGAPRQYSDSAVATVLTIRQLLHLPLRSAQGLVTSLFRLSKINLPVPDYTTLSRRAAGLPVLLQKRPKKKTLIIVDSSGVNVYGAGAWQANRRGITTAKGWKKIHVAIDERGEIRAVEVTDNSKDDAAAALALLPHEHARIHTFIADGAYDKRKVYAAAHRIPTVLIPPRIDAGLWSTTKRPHRRDAAVRFMRAHGKRVWKQESGYHRRSNIEATMFRWKFIVSERLRSRCEPQQRTEVLINANILNTFLLLGMPRAHPIT